jgi:hypothetical protein
MRAYSAVLAEILRCVTILSDSADNCLEVLLTQQTTSSAQTDARFVGVTSWQVRYQQS